MRKEQPVSPDVLTYMMDGWRDEESSGWGGLGSERIAAPPEGLDPKMVERILDAIDELPERLQDVINGLFFERVTQIEMARRLKVRRETVPVYLARALRDMKEALSEDL